MARTESILITGAAGFIGQVLAAALLESSPDISLTLTDVTKPPVPKSVSQHGNRVTAVSSDLTDVSSVASLLSTPFKAVYLLHGLMSGGAEANLELGWRVNWDSHRAILDQLYTHQPGTVVIFPSSLAVYGPTAPGEITSESTNPLPQSSYGAQKLMVETYLNDFSRRGLFDGRIVRLPTVVVRPGAPSAAASPFASGIIREPLQGQKSTLPVSRDLEMWICSPKTVAGNLIRVKDVPREKFGLSRVLNLPGITVTVQQILDAVKGAGGSKALDLIEEARDKKVEAIVGSWPARFDTSRAQSFGLEADRALEETVNDFARNIDMPKN